MDVVIQILNDPKYAPVFFAVGMVIGPLIFILIKHLTDK